MGFSQNVWVRRSVVRLGWVGEEEMGTVVQRLIYAHFFGQATFQFQNKLEHFHILFFFIFLSSHTIPFYFSPSDRIARYPQNILYNQHTFTTPTQEQHLPKTQTNNRKCLPAPPPSPSQPAPATPAPTSPSRTRSATRASPSTKGTRSGLSILVLGLEGMRRI